MATHTPRAANDHSPPKARGSEGGGVPSAVYSPVVLMEGMLLKRGSRVPTQHNWSERYFVLRGNVLSHYARRGDAKPKGVVVLGTDCTVSDVYICERSSKKGASSANAGCAGGKDKDRGDDALLEEQMSDGDDSASTASLASAPGKKVTRSRLVGRKAQKVPGGRMKKTKEKTKEKLYCLKISWLQEKGKVVGDFAVEPGQDANAAPGEPSQATVAAEDDSEEAPVASLSSRHIGGTLGAQPTPRATCDEGSSGLTGMIHPPPELVPPSSLGAAPQQQPLASSSPGDDGHGNARAAFPVSGGRGDAGSVGALSQELTASTARPNADPSAISRPDVAGSAAAAITGAPPCPVLSSAAASLQITRAGAGGTGGANGDVKADSGAGGDDAALPLLLPPSVADEGINKHYHEQLHQRKLMSKEKQEEMIRVMVGCYKHMDFCDNLLANCATGNLSIAVIKKSNRRNLNFVLIQKLFMSFTVDIHVSITTLLLCLEIIGPLFTQYIFLWTTGPNRKYECYDIQKLPSSSVICTV